MYLDPAETAAWVWAVAKIAKTHPAIRSGLIELFVLPSLPALPLTIDLLASTPIRVGAQDLHWDDRGAATGGVSGTDLRQLGCRYVEINHAERRQVFAESPTIAARKLAAAIRNDLTPIVCIGEQVRDSSNIAAAHCIAQLEQLLVLAPAEIPRLIVAYEPEWAIGASASADAGHVRAVGAELAAFLAHRSDIRSADLLYGGSAGPGLLPRLGTSVDGLFLGRFAHDPGNLQQVLDEAAATAGV